MPRGATDVLTLPGLGSDLLVVLVIAAGIIIALDYAGAARALSALLARVPDFMSRGAGGWGTTWTAIRLDGLALALVGATVAVLPIRVGIITVILFLAFVLVSSATIVCNYWRNRPDHGRLRMFRGRVRGRELLIWLLVWLIGAVLYVLQNQAYHYAG